MRKSIIKKIGFGANFILINIYILGGIWLYFMRDDYVMGFISFIFGELLLLRDLYFIDWRVKKK